MLTHCLCGSHVFPQFAASRQPPVLSRRAPSSGQGRGNAAGFLCPPLEEEEGWGGVLALGGEGSSKQLSQKLPLPGTPLLPLPSPFRSVYHSYPSMPSNVQWAAGGCGMMCRKIMGTSKEGLKATCQHMACRVLSPSNKPLRLPSQGQFSLCLCAAPTGWPNSPLPQRQRQPRLSPTAGVLANLWVMTEKPGLAHLSFWPRVPPNKNKMT